MNTDQKNRKASKKVDQKKIIKDLERIVHQAKRGNQLHGTIPVQAEVISAVKLIRR